MNDAVLHYKDAVLDELADAANVAQFVSFGPGFDLTQRFCHVRGFPPNQAFGSAESAVTALLHMSGEQSVNIRSFDAAHARVGEFTYRLTDVHSVMVQLRRLAASGMHTIVNETIDVHDGGVSGVLYGGIIEFAPGDTPRCVEKPGTVAFRSDVGRSVIETVYGFRLDVDYPDDVRTEFSIHPLKRGVRHEHTVLWEIERLERVTLKSTLRWPNRFSRLIGDKVFGLVVADAIGLRVPASTVVGRRVGPFRFGRPTGSAEHWIRTAPVEPNPGRFTTRKGWLDPFSLLMHEDHDGASIASVVWQEEVQPAYSGAAIISAGGTEVIEGVRGVGSDFMLGRQAPEALPAEVIEDVRHLLKRLWTQIGGTSVEWVHDGRDLWVVQLHQAGTTVSDMEIYPGRPRREISFAASKGLAALRELIESVQGTDTGIVLEGEVGVTSHLGDVLRKARVPSRVALPDTDARSGQTTFSFG